MLHDPSDTTILAPDAAIAESERLANRYFHRIEDAVRAHVSLLRDIARERGEDAADREYEAITRPFTLLGSARGTPPTGEERPIQRLLALAGSRGLIVRHDYHALPLLNTPDTAVTASELGFTGENVQAQLAQASSGITGYAALARRRSRWGTVHLRPWHEYPSASHALHTLAHEMGHAAATVSLHGTPPLSLTMEESRAELAGVLFHAWATRGRVGDLVARSASYLLGIVVEGGPEFLRRAGLLGMEAFVTLLTANPHPMPVGMTAEDDEWDGQGSYEPVVAA